MIKIIFKRFEKSEMVKEAVHERIEPILEKFPELKNEKIVFTLTLLNSRLKPGPDLFKIKVQIKSGQYKDLLLECSTKNFYTSLANIIEKIHERLRRHDEKIRSNQRQVQRRKKSSIMNHSEALTTGTPA